MKHIITISLSIICILFSMPISAQQTTVCDTIYNYMDTRSGKDREKNLYEIVLKTIPAAAFYSEDSTLITSTMFVLILDKTGKVIDLEFPQTRIALAGQALIREKLIGVEALIPPPQVDGHPVCTRMPLPIRCILWDK